MRKLEEYEKHAKDCRALAAKVTRPEDKLTLEEIARRMVRQYSCVASKVGVAAKRVSDSGGTPR
jgi:hypothetical protein